MSVFDVPIDHVCLNNGVKMPLVGLGTYPFQKKAVYQLIETAYDLGYRSFDTAWLYKNEIDIGAALKDLGVPRNEVFLTSKIHIDSLYWPRYYYSLSFGGLKYKSVYTAYRDSCRRLGVDYLDLYLIHWPFPGYLKMWKEMTKLYDNKLVRAIGVSSFMPSHLDSLKDNQIEMNPYNSRQDVVDYCKMHGILVEAYSPLGRGVYTKDLLSDSVISDIAANHSVSTAQVIVRWFVQRGIVAVPRTNKRTKLFQNISVFDFSLSDLEMRGIDGLNRDLFIKGDSRDVGIDGRNN